MYWNSSSRNHFRIFFLPWLEKLFKWIRQFISGTGASGEQTALTNLCIWVISPHTSKGWLMDSVKAMGLQCLTRTLLTNLLFHMVHLYGQSALKQDTSCFAHIVVFSCSERRPPPPSVVFTSFYGTPDKSRKWELFLDLSSESVENIQVITFSFSPGTVLILTFYIAIILFQKFSGIYLLHD